MIAIIIYLYVCIYICIRIYTTYFLHVARNLSPTTLTIYLVKNIFSSGHKYNHMTDAVSIIVYLLEILKIVEHTESEDCKLELPCDNLKGFITSNSCC